jgi:antirestriction protein ArdC
MRKDVYQVITDRILGLLSQDIVPWHRPWIAEQDAPKNHVSGHEYRGINPFLLLCTGYERQEWLTFNQAKRLDARVRKGEHGFPVIFWSVQEKKVKKDGKDAIHRFAFLKYFTVFNVEQIDGIDLPPKKTFEMTWKPIERCESVVAGMPKAPPIMHREVRAYYRPATDEVNLPARERFSKREEYYSTAFHELTHATGHTSRLGRPGIMDVAMFGGTDYSKEELVAEMGASFLCAHCGIEQATIDNSAAYIKGWLRKLRDDPKMVVSAAAQAQKAADFILGQKGEGNASRKR